MKTRANRRRKNRNLWMIVPQILLGLILGRLITADRFAPASGQPASFEHFLLELAYLLLSVFIAANLHELGHYAFGKMAGYRLLAYRIGFLSWDYENGKMKFSLKRNVGYGGLCAMQPPERELAHYQYGLFFAGGVIINVLSGLLMLAVLSLFPQISPSYGLFLLTFAATSLILGVANLLPFFSGNNLSDGMLLWGLVSHKPFAERFLELHRLQQQLGHRRPRDLAVHFSSASDEPDAYQAMLMLYAYFAALDSGDKERAGQCAAWLEQNIDLFPTPNLPSVYYELCFQGCIAGDTAKAKQYCQKAGRTLQRDRDVNGLRVKAYYEYCINQNKSLARDYCLAALAVADKFPSRGQGLMEADLVRGLLAEMS